MSLYVCNGERCAAAGVGLPSTVYINRTFHNGVHVFRVTIMAVKI